MQNQAWVMLGGWIGKSRKEEGDYLRITLVFRLPVAPQGNALYKKSNHNGAFSGGIKTLEAFS